MIEPNSHPFCRFIECWDDGGVINAVCEFDPETGDGKAILFDDFGRPRTHEQLAEFITRPVKVRRVRLMRSAPEYARQSFLEFVASQTKSNVVFEA